MDTLTASPDAKAAVGRFHADLAVAPTIADCTRIFNDTLRPFGIDTWSCGEVDLSDRDRNVFFVLEWPERWRKYYFQSELLERDPVVEALGRRRSPFTWNDLRADRTLSQLGSEALKKAMDFGWTDGLIVPIPRGGSRFGLISLVGSVTPFDAETKSLLALLCVSIHERVRAMAPVQGFAAPPCGLSDREIECLTLIAQGLSDKDIGLKIGIAASTAKEYFENAKRKLKASTRAQAVAMAVSLGIIVP